MFRKTGSSSYSTILDRNLIYVNNPCRGFWALIAIHLKFSHSDISVKLLIKLSQSAIYLSADPELWVTKSNVSVARRMHRCAQIMEWSISDNRYLADASIDSCVDASTHTDTAVMWPNIFRGGWDRTIWEQISIFFP